MRRIIRSVNNVSAIAKICQNMIDKLIIDKTGFCRLDRSQTTISSFLYKILNCF